MNHSGKSLFVKKVLLQPKRLVSRFRNVRGSRDDSEESERLVIEEYSAPPSLHHPPSPPQLNARSLTILDLDDVYSSWRYAQMAQDLRSSLPSTCRWLGPEVTKPVGFRSLPFSFLADRDSRNRTFAHHVGLPLADGLEMILRYLQRHLLSRFMFVPSNRFVT